MFSLRRLRSFICSLKRLFRKPSPQSRRFEVLYTRIWSQSSRFGVSHWKYRLASLRRSLRGQLSHNSSLPSARIHARAAFFAVPSKYFHSSTLKSLASSVSIMQLSIVNSSPGSQNRIFNGFYVAKSTLFSRKVPDRFHPLSFSSCTRAPSTRGNFLAIPSIFVQFGILGSRNSPNRSSLSKLPSSMVEIPASRDPFSRWMDGNHRNRPAEVSKGLSKFSLRCWRILHSGNPFSS